MVELYAIDVHYVVQELQSLIGAKIEKAYAGDGERKHDILLHLYCADGKKRNLRILANTISMPQERPEYPVQPPGFAMFLRKRICGSRITAVAQQNGDRIICFTCEYKGSPPLYLYVELMSPGNIILVDDKEVIINLLFQQQYKDRLLRARAPYVLPPAPYPLFSLVQQGEQGMHDLATHIAASTKESIVKTLALHCGMGGLYAEEACARAGIPKHRNDLTKEEILRITIAIREVLTQPLLPSIDDDRAGRVEYAERVYPFPFVSRATHPANTTMLGAIATLLAAEEGDGESLLSRESKTTKRTPAASSPTTKLQTLLQAQQSQITTLASASAQDLRRAELLYEQYHHFEGLLACVRAARERKEDVRAALAAYTAHLASDEGVAWTVSYNPANGELTVEIPDEQVVRAASHETTDMPPEAQ